MSPVFAARKRAEEFDSLLRGTSTGPADPERYADLLELVGALRETAPVEPRPAFVADLRERLMTAAETELAGAAPSVQDRLTLPRRSPRERRLAIAVGGFAVVGATTSMAVAAQSALPGDVLYPLKRAIENAHTGLSVDDEQKGSTLLANASGRLEEVDRLTRDTDRADLDVAAVQQTLADFTAQATEASDLIIAAYDAGGDQDAITELQQFTDASFAVLNQLAATADDEVRDALVPVGNALAAIEVALQQACPTCVDAVTQLPQWLLTGAQATTSSLDDLLGTTEEVASTNGPKSGQGTGSKGATGPKSTSQSGSGEPDTTGKDPLITLPSTGPTGGAGGGGGTGSTGGKDGKNGQGDGNAVSDLVDGLLGGDGDSTTTDAPGIPVVDDVVDGVGEVVEDLTNPLKP